MKPNNFPFIVPEDSTELYSQTKDVNGKFTLLDVKTYLDLSLDTVLSVDNSAGSNDIDLNNNDLLNVNNINLTTINGSPYSPSGLGGTTYIFVSSNGTAVDNAVELQAAYTQATTLSPSITNRITIVAAPSYYDFGASPFIMDTQYIDLVSLDGNRSIIFNSANAFGTISITANDVYVKGVDVETKNFTIGDNLNLLKIENCKGGNSSFGVGITVSGTFTNCEGGLFSFASSSGGTASGTFTNCIGGSGSFGGGASINATASGTFTNCIGGVGSFGGGVSNGTFINCIGAEYSFGSSFLNGIASGNYSYCIGGDGSFGHPAFGALTGKLYYCRLTVGTFLTVSGGGRTIYCIDGNNNTNNQ